MGLHFSKSIVDPQCRHLVFPTDRPFYQDISGWKPYKDNMLIATVEYTKLDDKFVPEEKQFFAELKALGLKGLRKGQLVEFDFADDTKQETKPASNQWTNWIDSLQCF